MLATVKKSLRRKLPHHSTVYAFARAAVSRHRLPPGKLVRLDETEKADRGFLLKQSSRFGPIFKAIAWNEFWICIIGLPLGRRLLKEHGDILKPTTLDVSGLFPKGFLRQMQGDDHRKYRKSLNRAIKPGDLALCATGLEAIAARALANYAAQEPEHQNSADAYIATLSAITSEMLILLFFGAEFGSGMFERLMAGYRKLGPYGLVWNIGHQQKEAFAEIRDCLIEHFSGTPAQLPPALQQCVLGRMVEDGMPDADMLGNLIYMVETGRYDNYSLFRWLTKHVADQPAMLERMARENDADGNPGRSFTDAFALETLRTDQSERLIRRVQSDFVFEGHLFPKHATLRVCLWESHKSPDDFGDPFHFEPERFLTRPPTGEQFAPFGLNHHRCPFGDMSLKMCAVFLRVLARGYTVAPLGDGLPVRGAYHWEPASRFGAKLTPRLAPSAA